jgi:predicted ATPase
LYHKAHFHHFVREWLAAQDTAEAALSVAEKGGFPLYASWAMVVKGCALTHLGHAEQGVAEIREGLASAAATGAEMWQAYNMAQLAEACAKAGQVDEGLQAITDALDVVQKKGERWWEAEIHRLRGALLLQQRPSDLAQPQICFARAIEIARHQCAKSLELRATNSLARLQKDTGRRDEARTMLAEVYGWFTEGFDMADLRDAKALLDELS